MKRYFSPLWLAPYVIIAVAFFSIGWTITRPKPIKHGYTILILPDVNNKQTGHDAILYDAERPVSVVHMDSTCHLWQAILNDNQ